MRASENALLKQLVLSTNIKTAWAATWFVLFLNWFQGIFPGENVFWVVPQLQDSPAQTWRHAAHKFVPGTLGLELSVDSYFQSGYFQMLPQHVLHPWVPSQWLWPLNLLQCPSPQELFFFVTDLFFHSRETAGCWLHPLIHARQSRVGLFSVPFSTKYIPSQTGFLGNQASKTEIDWVENRILQKFHFAMFNNEGTQLTEAVVNVCN